METAQKNLAR